MAIQVNKDVEKIVLTLDNGHKEALDKIVKDFDILNEEKAIGFMLSVLTEADGQPITIDGSKYSPSDSIKNPPEQPHAETSRSAE